MMLGNPYTGVTDEEFNQKAKIAGLKPKDIRSTTYDVYTYGEITIPSRMSTYIGMDCTPDGVIPDGADLTGHKVKTEMVLRILTAI